ncbi:hypothetical protein HOLleu_32901 [Holothuria leucospilota]|uniref:Uncharacterized protein n=1 Tax=Holothuria leucospilota TaxID=206669 RepID=A0A9Q0YMS3_HOLLE|nr:hypothetical protein HOLleu_32901 [Holothuria leucospilota]
MWNLGKTNWNQLKPVELVNWVQLEFELGIYPNPLPACLDKSPYKSWNLSGFRESIFKSEVIKARRLVFPILGLLRATTLHAQPRNISLNLA